MLLGTLAVNITKLKAWYKSLTENSLSETLRWREILGKCEVSFESSSNPCHTDT